MKSPVLLVIACALAIVAPVVRSFQEPATRLPGNGLAQHPFLYCGEWDLLHPEETMSIVRGGKVVWSYAITFGPASSTQLLDEPGVPEKGEQQR